MTKRTLHVETGALDNIPLKEISALLCQYGSEIVWDNDRLLIRRKRRNYKGYTFAPTGCGRLEVLAPPPDGGLIGEAPTIEDAKRLVDQQFEYEGPPAA